ncbi:MAG: hypothetical protein OQK12_07350, partial [Motiliproteus sp.]|nr:hypothetical protein [Motiliproteus sp.]
SGTVRIPEPPVLDLAGAPGDTDPGQRWPFFTLDRYQQWTGQEIYPWMLLMAPESKAGFVRKWPKPRVDDAMHTGYALQWFAFALIVLFIWAKLSFKKQQTIEELS